MKEYLTNYPGTGGTIRNSFEDFVVEEVLPFQSKGEGEHYLVLIEKKGISTMGAVREIARHLRISKSRIGYAGLKDAGAVARQWISIWSLDDLEFSDLPKIKFLEVHRHNKKLKTGQLKYNRFGIVIRGTRHQDVEPILRELEENGVPNFFGPQRFGSIRPNTHLVGRELVRGNIEQAVRLFVGNPFPDESEEAQEARRLFDQGDLKGAINSFPKIFYFEKSVVNALLEGRPCEQAFETLPFRLRILFVQAYQSHLFNKVLSIRLDCIKPIEGDILINGRPTGPLFGFKMKKAGGRTGEMEEKILREENLSLEDFKCPKTPKLASPGLRIPLTFPIFDVSVEKDPLKLHFSIPRGCYATSVLREIMKIPNS